MILYLTHKTLLLDTLQDPLGCSLQYSVNPKFRTRLKKKSIFDRSYRSPPDRGPFVFCVPVDFEVCRPYLNARAEQTGPPITRTKNGGKMDVFPGNPKEFVDECIFRSFRAHNSCQWPPTPINLGSLDSPLAVLSDFRGACDRLTKPRTPGPEKRRKSALF